MARNPIRPAVHDEWAKAYNRGEISLYEAAQRAGIPAHDLMNLAWRLMRRAGVPRAAERVRPLAELLS